MWRGSSRLCRVLRHCAVWLLCVPQPLWALTSDRDQPINIEADSATVHDKSGSSTYTGNVHLVQGTLNLRGDKMTVQMRNNHVETIVLTGNPATYVQRPDNSERDRHAEARRIEYHASSERMILLDNARIWQAENEEFRSDRIVFNLAEKTINAGGSDGSERVRITLQPQTSGTSTPAPQPVAEPAPDAAPPQGGAASTDNLE